MDRDKLTQSLSQSELDDVKKYQTIYGRLKFLQAQMDEIQDETNDLIETLEKMRIKNNKNKNNG